MNDKTPIILPPHGASRGGLWVPRLCQGTQAFWNLSPHRSTNQESETSVPTDPQTKNLMWEGQSTLLHTRLLAKQHLKLSNGNEHDLKNVRLVSYKRGTWPGMLKNMGLILLLALLSRQSQMEGVAHGLQGFCGLWWGGKSDQRKQEIQYCCLRNCKNLTSP